MPFCLHEVDTEMLCTSGSQKPTTFECAKDSPCNAGNLGLISGSGRSPGGGNGNPLQYACLENSMGRGALRATVYGVTKSWTQLKQLTYKYLVT